MEKGMVFWAAGFAIQSGYLPGLQGGPSWNGPPA